MKTSLVHKLYPSPARHFAEVGTPLHRKELEVSISGTRAHFRLRAGEMAVELGGPLAVAKERGKGFQSDQFLLAP